MKLRLQITTSPDSTFPFDHPGPTVLIGRNPEGDLTFASAVNQVSWNHARIDLGAKGAFLTDLESTNGTFVNDRRLTGKSSLKSGDHVQLGQTGPLLKVLELDLADAQKPMAAPPAAPRPVAPPPLTAPPPPAISSPAVPLASTIEYKPGQDADPHRQLVEAVHRTQRNALIGIGVVAVSVVFLVAVLFWKFNKPASQVALATTEATHPQTQTTNQKPPIEDTATGNGKPTHSRKPKNGNDETPPPPPPDPKAPLTDRVDVGRYVAPDKDPPSVLIERQSDPYPWGRLKPQSPVYTGKYLTSLPGYRSKVSLNSNVHLTLWGNLPDFSAVPPVLESVVILNAPGPGVDLDFTLDRGRVHLRNFKGKQSALVRVRFFKEIWDLTFPNSESEAILELWGAYPPDVPFSKEPGGDGPVAALNLVVKGQATLKIEDREIPMQDLSYIYWLSRPKAPVKVQKLQELPKWWTNQIDTKSPELLDVLLGLKDYSTMLSKTDAVVDALRTQIRESRDGTNRRVGVLFLGSVEDVSQLVDLLEDRQNAEVRGTAAFALRNWMSRGRDQELDLYRMLYEKKGYSREKAEIIMQLLHYFSARDLSKPETYQTLIGYLDHENLAIRELAFWHLLHLVSPESLSKIPKEKVYDPNADLEKRKPAVDEWKRLIPPGKIPPRPSQ